MVYVWIWLALLVGFVVVEALTIQLVSVWFICGAFCAMLAALLGVDILIQCFVFLAVSVLLLALLRPLVKNKLITPIVATNTDMIIGKVGVVKETIDNDLGCGRITVNGQLWSARSYYGAVISEGVKVTVYAIDGVKLIVYPYIEQ